MVMVVYGKYLIGFVVKVSDPAYIFCNSNPMSFFQKIPTSTAPTYCHNHKAYQKQKEFVNMMGKRFYLGVWFNQKLIVINKHKIHHKWHIISLSNIKTW